MDACTREAGTSACAVSTIQDQLCGKDQKRIGPIFFTLIHMMSTISLNTDMAVSDFEEQLGHGLGKNAVDVLKFRPWLCIVKKWTSSGKHLIHYLV